MSDKFTIEKRRYQLPVREENLHKINEEITAQEVSVVAEGELLGTMPTPKALEMARSREMDLVEVAPNQVPPVCRIMSFSKFKYELSKKAKKAKVKGKAKELKEMRFPVLAGEGDIQHKLNRVNEFLEKGHKVKITVVLRGRALPEFAGKLVDRILTALSGSCTIEQPLKKMQKNWYFIVVPVKSVKHTEPKQEDITKIDNKPNLEIDNSHAETKDK